MSIISKDGPRQSVHMPAVAEKTKHPEGDWHTLTKDEVLQLLDSHEAGLSNDEVIERRAKYGHNKLDEKPPVPRWVRFLEQFQDPMVYLLIIAALIAFVFEKDDVATPIFIVIALTLNAFFGYLQESKAEEAMASLKKLLVSHCVALRDGSEFKVSIDELVPGDIIWLEDGLNVPADVRIIEVHQLLIDESSLTGESNVIHKQVDPVSGDMILQEQSNMAFMGTVVSSGRAKAIVTRVGMNTMLGTIASGISDVTTPKTPLEVKLEQLGKFLGWIAITCSVLLILLQVVKNWFGPSAQTMYEVIAEQFLVSVVIFVAIVPEGLPIILVISLSMGMRNMARQKAIVRRMKAVETLGSTTIICTDKTGTLTRNQMDFMKMSVNGTSYGLGVTEVGKNVLLRKGLPIPKPPPHDENHPSTPNVNFIDPGIWEVLQEPAHPNHEKLSQFLLSLALNHDVMPEYPDPDEPTNVVYSATSPDEGALVSAAKHFGQMRSSRSVRPTCCSSTRRSLA